MAHVNVACLEAYTGWSQGVWRQRNFSGNDSSHRVVGSTKGLWDSEDHNEMLCVVIVCHATCHAHGISYFLRRVSTVWQERVYLNKLLAL